MRSPTEITERKSHNQIRVVDKDGFIHQLAQDGSSITSSSLTFAVKYLIVTVAIQVV